MTNKEILLSTIDSINNFEKVEKVKYVCGMAPAPLDGMLYYSISLYYYGKLFFREDHIGLSEEPLYNRALSQLITSGIYQIINNVDLAK